MDGKEHRFKPRRNLSRSPKKTTCKDYIQEIKKMVQEYEKKFGELPKPVELPEWMDQTYKGIGFHEYDEEPCAVRNFFKLHPDHTGPVMIACQCRRCGVYC